MGSPAPRCPHPGGRGQTGGITRRPRPPQPLPCTFGPAPARPPPSGLGELLGRVWVKAPTPSSPAPPIPGEPGPLNPLISGGGAPRCAGSRRGRQSLQAAGALGCGRMDPTHTQACRDGSWPSASHPEVRFWLGSAGRGPCCPQDRKTSKGHLRPCPPKQQNQTPQRPSLDPRRAL